MIYYIRVDASLAIGTGHVMRCLTLAQELAERGGRITFVFREIPDSLESLISRQGFGLFRLPIDLPLDREAQILVNGLSDQRVIPDWLIIDHYKIDVAWEEKIRPYIRKIMVIDDLADRMHDCDVLLDQNYYSDMNGRYDKIVSNGCIKLLGPRFLLLRQEFTEKRGQYTPHKRILRRILIFFGGSDPTNETMKTIKALSDIGSRGICADVVVGGSNPEKESIREFCERTEGFSFYCQVTNIAEIMARADLAVGAGGTATWERCSIGLPTIAIVVAPNQEKVIHDLASNNVLVSLGNHQTVSQEQIRDAVLALIEDRQRLLQMSKNALSIMSTGDGKGELLSILLESNHV